MKKRKNSFLDQVAECDPEMAEIIAEMKQDEAAGALRYPPQSDRDVRDWRDAWLYSFKRASLHPSDFMRLENGRITCVVWIGSGFNDNVARVIETIAQRLGADLNLLELRLISTNISDQGLQRLKTFLPKATITQYTEEARQADPRLAYADPAKAKEMFPDNR